MNEGLCVNCSNASRVNEGASESMKKACKTDIDNKIGGFKVALVSLRCLKFMVLCYFLVQVLLISGFFNTGHHLNEYWALFKKKKELRSLFDKHQLLIDGCLLCKCY